MTVGTILALAALLTVVGTLAWYYPKMMNVSAPLRPWREQALMAAALLMAGSAGFLHAGIFGYISASLAAVLATLFLLVTLTSGMPDQHVAVSVGSRAPDFRAFDAHGNSFRLSDLRGSPVLVKFFRGHW
jgi:hypothetical protein